MTDTRSEMTHWDPAPAVEAIYRDGIVSLPGALDPAWVDDLRRDFETLFEEARHRDGGVVNRGPQRYYFAVHPERLRGFVDLVTHPLVTRLSEQMLGPDYAFVEVAFDVPLAGAVHQPWHRDFPTPAVTAADRRLNSLAFNVTTVDVAPDMGPFEIAPGTQWDDGTSFAHGMFPPPQACDRYASLGEKRFPRRGDMSARTGLTVHRGTPNTSANARAVLILGVVAPEVETDVHDLVLTRRYADALPDAVRRHLRCTVVEELSPLVQQHSIEGLVMGECPTGMLGRPAGSPLMNPAQAGLGIRPRLTCSVTDVSPSNTLGTETSAVRPVAGVVSYVWSTDVTSSRVRP